jgi:AcrR family transcriptional regulator
LRRAGDLAAGRGAGAPGPPRAGAGGSRVLARDWIEEEVMSETRDRILHTALSLFAERGVDGVSIADITAAVGIAKSSLYSHFESKEAILDSILKLYRTSIEERTVDPAAYDRMIRQMSPEEFWNAILDRYLDTWSSGPLLLINRLIVLEQYKTETALELILEETRRILGLSRLIFERMIELERIQPYPPAALAREFAYAVRGMLMEYDVLVAHGRDTEPITSAMRAFVHSFCSKIVKGEKS